MANEALGPFVLFDAQVAAGNIADVFGEPFDIGSVGIPYLQVSHSGLGASAAGVVQHSLDGVNWTAGSAITLTATTPTTLVVLMPGSIIPKFIRVVITHGGANGGRVTVLIQAFRGEE